MAHLLGKRISRLFPVDVIVPGQGEEAALAWFEGSVVAVVDESNETAVECEFDDGERMTVQVRAVPPACAHAIGRLIFDGPHIYTILSRAQIAEAEICRKAWKFHNREGTCLAEATGESRKILLERSPPVLFWLRFGVVARSNDSDFTSDKQMTQTCCTGA
jgi:hypothetical protein